MMKNVHIKKFLKVTVFKGITIINKLVPKKDNYIMLYSGNKGISFNLKPLKQYLISEGYCAKNKVYCGIEKMKYADNDECIYINHLKSILYFMRCKNVFYTAGQLPIKPSKKQNVFHLQHGVGIKTLGKLTKIDNGNENYFSKLIVSSEGFKEVLCKAYDCKIKDIIINSEPMTDVFFKKVNKYDFGNFKKIILWVPTFRQSDYLGYNDSNNEELLPMFQSKDYIELNEFLKKYDYKLIVKLHPSQKLTDYKKLIYSNLVIMSDNDFKNNNWDLYEMLPQIDLLIADYSSIYLQFLLLDKPMCFAVPDLEEYSEKRGFFFDNITDYMPGEILKSKDDLYRFIEEFSNGIDKYKEKRKIVKNFAHKYADGNSCARLIKMSNIRK